MHAIDRFLIISTLRSGYIIKRVGCVRAAARIDSVAFVRSFVPRIGAIFVKREQRLRRPDR